MRKYLIAFREAVMQALAHDVINTSKAVAYSGMLMLFPALLLITTLVAQIQEGSTLLGDLRSIYEKFLPTDTLDLLQSYVISRQLSSDRLIFSAAVLSFFAGIGVMLSLMEGFRRAYRLPRGTWNFWRERVVAFGLIPITLVPMLFATLLIVFGHQIERWMIDNADHEFRLYVLFLWRMVRWMIAMATSVAVLAVIYHFGTPQTQDWRKVLPGALLATATWFLITLLYGLYVTRFADYSIVYGSLGAAVATLVWLYMVSISILIGAEFNAQIFPVHGSRPLLNADDEENAFTQGKTQTA